MKTLNIQFLIVFALLGWLGNGGFGQGLAVDTVEARASFERALLCEETEHWDSAVVYMEDALCWFGEVGVWERWVDAVNLWGRYMDEAGRAAENRVLLDSALALGISCWGEMDLRVAESYRVLGWCHYAAVEKMDSAGFLIMRDLYVKKEKIGENHPRTIASWKTLELYNRSISNFPEALYAARKVLEISINCNRKDHYEVASAYNILGINQLNLGMYDAAIRNLEKSLEMRKLDLGVESAEFAESLHNIGVLYDFIGEFEKSKQNYELVIRVREKVLGQYHFETAMAYDNLGVVLGSLGDFEGSLKSHLKALRIRAEILENDHESIAMSYVNIGGTYGELGDFVKAEEMLLVALDILLGKRIKDQYRLAITYGNLGTVLWGLDEYETALKYYEKSLKNMVQVFGYNHPFVATCYHNIGQVLQSKGDCQKAINYTLESIIIRKRVFGDKEFHDGTADNNLALAMLCVGDTINALRHLEKSIEFDVRHLSPNHPSYSIGLMNMGDFLNDRKEFENALRYYHDAIVSMIKGDYGLDLQGLPPLVDIVSKDQLLRVLRKKASIFDAIGEYESLVASVSTYRLATSLIDSLRISFSHGSKALLGEESLLVSQAGLAVASRLNKMAPDTCYLHDAWHFMEKSKSTLLHEALKDHKARKFANIPDSLLEKENYLKVRLAYNERRLIDEETKLQKDSSKIAQFRDRVFELKQQKDSLLARFKRSYPKYYQLKYDLSIATIPDVQAWLPNDSTTLIEYFYGDSNIYVFTVTKRHYHLQSFPNDSLFKSHLNALQAHFKNPDEIENGRANDPGEYQKFSETAHALYKILLAPMLDSLDIRPQHLILIPDGPLGKLPFDCLLTREAMPSDSAPFPSTSLSHPRIPNLLCLVSHGAVGGVFASGTQAHSSTPQTQTFGHRA